MLALIAGEGRLPELLKEHAPEALICALDGVETPLPVAFRFRLETFGGLLATLKRHGVHRLVMAGAITRPGFDPGLLDAETLPLMPRLRAALTRGDDGALRVVIALVEEAGIALIGAADLMPELLPPAGVLAGRVPDGLEIGPAEAALAEMGRIDQGQAVLVLGDEVVAREGQEGTEALIAAAPPGAWLYKAPKPGQARRADLPTIGADTIAQAQAARLSGIVIASGGVILLDQAVAVAAAQAAGLFLWVRA